MPPACPPDASTPSALTLGACLKGRLFWQGDHDEKKRGMGISFFFEVEKLELLFP